MLSYKVILNEECVLFIHNWGCLIGSFVCLFFPALATLKPQAGLVAPQAVPASQPAAAVKFDLFIELFSFKKKALY